MRRALTLTLGLLFFAAGTIVACAEDDPEPGFTPTGGSGGSESAGNAGSAQGGGGSGGGGQAGGGPKAGSGGGGAGGQAGAGGQGAACGADANEPNENPLQARTAPGVDGDGTMSDCDDEDSLNGLLDGPEDEDWFRYTAIDNVCLEFGDNIGPHVRLGNGVSAEVCMFIKPGPDAGAIECDAGSEPSDELDGQGFVGCCSNTEARMTFGGGNSNDAGDVLMKVSKLSEGLCGAYTITFAQHE
ncbi:MAG TPA: hypothetical protein VFS43_02230 [Polyangiaceae bacterium]|nr:hypothetical protein [Polyangiaceae bacterium]